MHLDKGPATRLLQLHKQLLTEAKAPGAFCQGRGQRMSLPRANRSAGASRRKQVERNCCRPDSET